MVRSDNVGSLTPAGREAMAAYGVNTVIDLRTESEVKGAPSPFAGSAMYHHIPLVDDATSAVLNEAPEMPDRYVLMLERRQAALAGIFTTMAVADGTVVFHCFAGKDRTGLVAALTLSLAGVDWDAIGADYAETDVQLATKYAEWLAAAPPGRAATMRAELRCPPEWMLAAVEHLNRQWGGVEPYLEAAGTSGSAITRLQSRLSGLVGFS